MGGSGGLQWKFEVLLSFFIHQHPQPSPNRIPLAHSHSATTSCYCENAFALERYKTRTSDHCQSHEIYMSFTLQLVFVDVTVI